MRYLDEFRKKERATLILDKIKKSICHNKPIRLMEVCGTHTQSFFRHGLKSLLPKNIRLISGPGCPVCVSGQDYIDRAILFAKKKDNIIATFGDMVRVPGTDSSLEREKALGADVRIVYSSLDALRIAQENPQRNIVFLGVGFETTAPTVAVAILSAKRNNLKNFFVFNSLKLIPPAMEALVKDRDLEIQGFLCPGHVSAIIGVLPYEFIAHAYSIPCVIAGFEPLDILEGIFMLIKQIGRNEAKVQNQYTRVVRKRGNLRAQTICKRVFDITNVNWRGLGVIPKSALKIKKEFSSFNAEKVFNYLRLKKSKTKHSRRCICADVLKGKKLPLDCPLFADFCRPANPIGPCMVSSEGTCSTYYKYEKN